MNQKQNRSSLLYCILLACGALIYAVLSITDNVWADEAYTFAMIRHSFSEIWNITAADVHPPLYYFAAKLFAAVFGHGEFTLRIFSALFYLALLGIGGWQISRLFDQKTGLCFMVLFLLYPFSLEQAAVVRMYTMASLAVFLNALFAYRAWCFNKIWDWVGFLLAGVCAAYTHYFALVSAGIIYGLLFLCILAKNRKLLKIWFAASLVTIALYLPWLKCFIEQLIFKVNNDYWIAPITVSTIIDYGMTLLHANGFGFFPLYFGLILGALLLVFLREKKWVCLLALAVPMLTTLLGIGVSLVVRPVFIIRYVVPSAPLLIFFLAYGLGELRRSTWFSAVISVLLVAFSANTLYAFTTIPSPVNKINTELVERLADAEAYVVVNDFSLHISQVLSYYDPETPIYIPDRVGADNPYPNHFEIREFSTENLNSYVVMTDEGMLLDEDFKDGFRAACIGTYVDVYNHVDVWVLTRE